MKGWKERYFETGFKLRTKRGEKFSISFMDTNDPDIVMLYKIWELGRKYVYSWIISTARGIIELEELGLFHCDIELRNTVKFGDIFKLIDFDYVFKVRIVGSEEAENSADENMLAILAELLRLEANQRATVV